MHLVCPSCQISLPIPAERSAGKQIRCPKCRQTFVVPAVATAAAGSRTRVGPPPLPTPPPRSASAPAPVPPAGKDGILWKKLVLAGVVAMLLLPMLGIIGSLAWRQRAARASRHVAQRDSQAESSDVQGEKPTPSGDGVLSGPDAGGGKNNSVPLALGGSKPVQFMGLATTGNRVCIIADVSGSMNSFARIDRLRKEVKKTLTELAPEQEFHVIFFHTTADPQPLRGWVRGSDAGQVMNWVEGQTARGGTMPMPAFQLAFGLNPRPDVIFFMTDGMIPPKLNVPADVAKLNAKEPKKVPIHTILFGGEEPGANDSKLTEKVKERLKQMRKQAEASLEPISKESGGTHRFVPDDPNAVKNPKVKKK